jgi:hypothetical protein
VGAPGNGTTNGPAGDNTGSGGAGCWPHSMNGGSGIVIIRY